MNEAIWFVIGDAVPVVCGVLLALYVLTAVLVALLDGLRVDRWAIYARRRGVMRGIRDERKKSI